MRQRDALIAILVILVAAAVGVPWSMDRARQRAMRKFYGCVTNLVRIRTACEMRSTDSTGRFPATLAVLVPSYLRSIPTCPAAEVDTYSPSFTSASNPDMYTVFCMGGHHAEVRPGRNQPWCSSLVGPDDDALLEPRALAVRHCKGRARSDVLAWLGRNGVRVTRDEGGWVQGEEPSHPLVTPGTDYVFLFGKGDRCQEVYVEYHDGSSP